MPVTPQDEAAALETEMDTRHIDELRALEARVAAAEGDGPVDAVAAALAANSLYAPTAEADSQQVWVRA